MQVPGGIHFMTFELSPLVLALAVSITPATAIRLAVFLAARVVMHRFRPAGGA